MNGRVRRHVTTLERVLIAGLAAARALRAAPPPPPAQVQPYRANDFGGFRDVLPPGTNGRSNLVELAAFLGDRRAARRTTTTSATCTRGCSPRRPA